MKKTAIYIASTAKNVGKTSLSIGLIGYLKKQGYKVAFMKPIGQRYKEIDGKKISKGELQKNSSPENWKALYRK